MAPLCYVSMPFGIKSSSSGTPIHFDEVYRKLIRPAVKSAGYKSVRADESLSGAPIMEVVIKLISDSELMVADLTLSNPNIIYEVGVRHALVPSRTVLIKQNDGSPVPFNLASLYFSMYQYPLPEDHTALKVAIEQLQANIELICADRSTNFVYRTARYALEDQEYLRALQQFHRVAPYEQSVFLMTKYPEQNSTRQTDKDRELERIIETVRRALRGHGLTPRLASEISYHSIVWKNIEVYLLGCSKGVAIVENKYTVEVNPNVAMEWGWMRAEKKDVLYLLESDFKNERADFSGFVCERFSWDYPEKHIEAAIAKWVEANR